MLGVQFLEPHCGAEHQGRITGLDCLWLHNWVSLYVFWHGKSIDW